MCADVAPDRSRPTSLRVELDPGHLVDAVRDLEGRVGRDDLRRGDPDSASARSAAVTSAPRGSRGRAGVPPSTRASTAAVLDESSPNTRARTDPVAVVFDIAHSQAPRRSMSAFGRARVRLGAMPRSEVREIQLHTRGDERRVGPSPRRGHRRARRRASELHTAAGRERAAPTHPSRRGTPHPCGRRQRPTPAPVRSLARGHHQRDIAGRCPCGEPFVPVEDVPRSCGRQGEVWVQRVHRIAPSQLLSLTR